MGSFGVCYSFVGFAHVYYLVHQGVVIFCFVYHGKSGAQFFSNVYVCFVVCQRISVQFFVFFNFSNVHVCFLLCYDQFFCILVVFMSVLFSVIELRFSFFVFANFSSVHVCFVFHHVQFFVFTNFGNVIQVLIMYLNLRVYLAVFVFICCVLILWYFVLQAFVFFNFSNVLQVHLNLRVYFSVLSLL